MSTLTRGHSLPLRLTIPPLRTPQGFACSVASLSRCPCHYPPGHHSLRRAALAECPLGQGKPSTRPEGHDESTYTSQTSFHSDDRRTWPLPADKMPSPTLHMQARSVLCNQCTLHVAVVARACAYVCDCVRVCVCLFVRWCVCVCVCVRRVRAELCWVCLIRNTHPA